MASNGEEMEPVDKEKEIQIEFFLEAFRDYIAKTVDYRDLMFFKHFTLDQKKQFRSQAKKGADDSVVTNEMIGVILDMKDKPGRYSTLVNLFQFELENQKVSHILQGKQMPSYAGQQKEKIQRVMKVICENLDIVEILPVLLQHKLIIGRESQNLQNTAKNESNHEAALDLIVGMLSNRQIHWYSKFLLCLIEAGMEFLAEKIDKPVYDRILGYQKEKGKSLSAQEQDHLFQSCEEYGMTSLIPIKDSPSLYDTYRSSDDTIPKDVYKDELTLDEKTQRKQVVESEYTAVKQIDDSTLDFRTLEAPVLKDEHTPSLSKNNLSPFKPDEFSMSSLTSVESAKRSLSENFTQSFDENPDMSLNFNSLLQDNENISKGQVKSANDMNEGRSYNSSEFGSGLEADTSLDSYLENVTLHDSNIANRQKSMMSFNSFDSANVQVIEPKQREQASFSQFQKLTTSKSVKAGESTTEVNVDTPQPNSISKDNLYDRTKFDSKSDDFRELKDENERSQLNITETASYEKDEDDIEDVDIKLRQYQQELAAPALAGKNVIIVAPTGSGKTRVAMRIIQDHIRQQKGRAIAKVVFLVNQVALANQQGNACGELLKKYTSKVITGESQRKSECLKDFIDKRDILIVTAQVLLDALLRKEISGIDKFSLIVFDECHHTHANHTFNQIMGRYMDLKFDKPDISLPQIVGLTASVGVGKAKNEDKAVEHIKQLMANLDAHVICTVQKNVGELRQHVSLPEEETFRVPKRRNDTFHENIVKLMNTIEKRMNQSSLVKEIPEATKIESALKAPSQKGAAQYTQWVSKLWRETAKLKLPDARRFLNSCRAHLEHYNNALIIYNDARMEDALSYLDAEMNKWKENAIMDENELVLHGAFKKLRGARCRNCPNPKLDKLCEMITKAYKDNFENSRGIVFVKTRDLSKAILSWMKETPGLRELNPIVFVGTNMAADKGGMTKAEQVDALEYFRNGHHKLIIATSVAEEGLDISKCNLVIRYDHVTNEIAMVQSRGRGRAEDSKYFVIAEENTGMAEKEELNMIREVMMRKAIIQLQDYIQHSPDKFRKEIQKFQDEANLDRQLKSLGSRRKLVRSGQFELRCVKCDHFICWSDDIKKVQDSHHVVIDKYLSQRVTFVKSGSTRYQDDAIQFVGKLICKDCGGNLGVICIHRTLEFPVLKIEHFLIVDTNGRQDTCKKWKSAPFIVPPLTNDDWKEIVKSRKETGEL